LFNRLAIVKLKNQSQGVAIALRLKYSQKYNLFI